MQSQAKHSSLPALCTDIQPACSSFAPGMSFTGLQAFAYNRRQLLWTSPSLQAALGVQRRRLAKDAVASGQRHGGCTVDPAAAVLLGLTDMVAFQAGTGAGKSEHAEAQ